jgi:isopenicillin-N N-acyltransferase-like protein
VRALRLPAGASPRTWGEVHGESYRGEIQSLCAIRTYLCTRVGGFPDAASVVVAARAHLPVLERYDAALYEELRGIADGAAVTPEDIVVANHYTDLRDLSPDPGAWKPAPIVDDPGGCSMIFADTPTGRIVAQTWDMHATAAPYVMMLGVPATGDAPAAWLLSVTGCLGMAGMNAHGVAVAINNLYSTDATLGVVWPALVRKALRCPTAAAGREIVMTTPIGSGHHYLVADRDAVYAIETSGVRRKQIFAGERPQYCHTNHCLDPDVAARSKVPPGSTTFDRQTWLEHDLERAPIADIDDAWRRLGSQDGWPRSVSTNVATPENPHGAATCGAIAMNLATRDVRAQAGFITNVAPERFEI